MSRLFLFAFLCVLLAATVDAMKKKNREKRMKKPRSRFANPKEPVFSDVTVGAGITQVKPRLIKYGGPTVADLDSDGYPDLLFVHHDTTFAELYFNNRDGTFTKSSWRLWTDMHGINVCPESVHSKKKLFTISSGGNYGKTPTPPRMYLVNGRTVTDITEQSGVHVDGGRGRTTLYMDMKKSGFLRNPDIVVTNAKPIDQSKPSHFAYLNLGLSAGKGHPTYQRRSLSTYQYQWNSYAMATDINGDRQMEMISYHNLTVYNLAAPFKFVDITNQVIPTGFPRVGVVSICEFDYDNDGDMDLYIARTNTGDLKWLWGTDWRDLLLRNDGGKFVEVGKAAGVPQNTQSRGVTCGDFNSDGYLDCFISQHDTPDIMLMNRGDGTFKSITGLVQRPWNVHGDQAQAVDYDLDGRLDLIVSQGDQFDANFGGSFRILRNVGPQRRYLLVRVGHAPDKTATALHAIVTVKTEFGLTMTRRVGSVGDAVSRSFIDTVHFGMRGWTTASVVKVVWSSGTEQFKWQVDITKEGNKILNFGIV